MKTTVEDIAILCHEVNRAYCASIGDTAQLPWADTTHAQRTSIRVGVRAHLANPQLTPEQSHEKWLEHKRAHGWKWGPEKNDLTKEHPCFMSYLSLPVEQRVKDHLFKAVVNTCASQGEVLDGN